MSLRILMATIRGSASHRRLQVALDSRDDGRWGVELIQQDYAPGIGWFNQHVLVLDPNQFRGLQAIGGLKRTMRAAGMGLPVADGYVMAGQKT